MEEMFMNIIEAGYQILSNPKETNIYKNIEKVARLCYKSEDKICEGSAEKMVNGLVKRHHEAMLEHESLFFCVPTRVDYDTFVSYVGYMESTGFNCMLKHTYIHRGIVSGNIRAWRDFIRETLLYINSEEDPNNLVTIPNVVYEILANRNELPILFDDFELPDPVYLFDFAEYVPISKEELTDMEKITHYPITVKFTTDIGVGREITRHRIASFAQESTRYCNYSKDGFGSEITVVKPVFFDEGSDAYNAWKVGCEAAEKAYMELINMGRTPQEARDVLPLSTKAELCMTATVDEWRHFFLLRAADSTGAAHPQMKEVTIPLLLELQKLYPQFFDYIKPAIKQ